MPAKKLVHAHLRQMKEILRADDLRTERLTPAAAGGQRSDLLSRLGLPGKRNEEIRLGQRGGRGIGDGFAAPVSEERPQHDFRVPGQSAERIQTLNVRLYFDPLAGVILHPTRRHGRTGDDRLRFRIRHIAHDRRLRRFVPAGTEVDERLGRRGVRDDQKQDRPLKAHERVPHVDLSPLRWFSRLWRPQAGTMPTGCRGASGPPTF